MNDPVSTLHTITQLYQTANYQQAAALCSETIKQFPKHLNIRPIYAACLLKLLNFKEAQRQLEHCLQSGLQSAEIHFNLGLAFTKLDKYKKALRHFQQALDAGMQSAELFFQLGHTSGLLKKEKQAERYLQQSIQKQSFNPVAHHLLAETQSALSKTKEACANYCIAGTQYASTKLDTANICFQASARLVKKEDQILENIGVFYYQSGEFILAEKHLTKALKIKPDSALYNYNFACLLLDMHKPDNAALHFQKAFELDKNFTQALVNKAKCSQLNGQYIQAEKEFKQAIQKTPNDALAHYNLGLLKLGLAQFNEGWKGYVWRIAQDHNQAYLNDPRLPSRILPTPIDILESDWQPRTITLINDQGLGDILFFLRFVRPLQQRGISFQWLVTEKLHSLLQNQLPDVTFIDSKKEISNNNVVISDSDLGLLLEEFEDNATPEPLFLKSHPEIKKKIKKSLQELGPPPYITLTWEAGTRGSILDQKLFKRIEPEKLGQLLLNSDYADATFINIQRNPQQKDIQLIEKVLGKPLHDFTSTNDNLVEMLALLDLIDEYIGVSNTNMHLRASLKKPAQVMVPLPGEWRWMWQGNQSPWFPDFNLIRQSVQHGWDKALIKNQL